MRRFTSLLLLWALMSLPSVAAEHLTIKGSNTFGEELGPRLIQEFCRSNPNMTVEMESKGTATGLAALLAGECDIASASRAINEDETRLARSRNIRLNFYLIGSYAVSVIVNANNPVRQLTDVQVRDVFTGVVTNWAQLGGTSAPITTYIRDPISGTYLGFQELAMERRPYATSAQPFRNYAKIAAMVAADPQGIGYVGMRLSNWPEVRAVAINGVAPSALAVEDGRYPYARMLRLYTNSRHESAATKQFVHFVMSRRGQTVLEQLGYVPRVERRLWSPSEP